MKQKVLFVCLGNICRSPAANGILEQMVAKRGLQEYIEVDSAGTYPGHRGNLPDPRMRRAAAERGYDLTHRARTVSEDDFYDFDMIIVMGDSNYERVSRLAPERKYLDKLHRMVEFVTDYPDYSYIPDPYYEGAEGFYLVLNMLENNDEMKDEIRKQFSAFTEPSARQKRPSHFYIRIPLFRILLQSRHTSSKI